MDTWKQDLGVNQSRFQGNTGPPYPCHPPLTPPTVLPRTPANPPDLPRDPPPRSPPTRAHSSSPEGPSRVGPPEGAASVSRLSARVRGLAEQSTPAGFCFHLLISQSLILTQSKILNINNTTEAYFVLLSLLLLPPKCWRRGLVEGD
ncbi:uncharacterized protein [Symphalangus syndactylus]|uniref:uncharacterized protein n=1 Tax=Symphalangus syndactylus TaxID=9590 RepID=UPI0024436F4B|nr:uncharacterized protein LOC129478558 [Symphalangus syndactylus]